MPSTITDRLYGENSSVAVKAPVRMVSVGANLVLTGLQTVGGVALNEGDRILVKDQSIPSTNGIYNVSASAWQRAGDFDGPYDVVQGTLVIAVLANGGSLFFQLTTANPIQIDTSPLTFAPFYIGAQVNYPQTPVEVLAGVPPVNPSLLPGVIRRYGAMGNGVADDTIAIRNACLVMQAGQKVLDFEGLTYKIYSNPADTALLGNFTGLSGIHIKSDGATFQVSRDFPTAVFITAFQFTTCNDITIDDFIGTYTGAARSEIYTRGVQLFQFIQTCTNVRIGNVDLTDWAMAVRFQRAENVDPQSYRCSNIRIDNIKGLRVGYPLMCDGSGDNLWANVQSDSCGRSYFCYAPRNHKVVVRSKNQNASADCLLYAMHGGEDMSDIDLTYVNTESTDNSVGTRRGVYLAFRDGDLGPGIMRNIDIKVHIEPVLGGTLSNGVDLDKLIASGAVDTVDRGHTVHNLKISGYLDTTSGPLVLGDQTTWGLGEHVDNLELRNLQLFTGQSNLGMFASLDKNATLENITGPSLNLTGNTRSWIKLKGVNVPNVTLGGADTSQMSFDTCNITSGTTQSFNNKTFKDTLIAGTMYASVTTGMEGRGQSATAVVIAAGNTITTAGLAVSRVAPAGNVATIILQAGTLPGQKITVVNESAFTITFDVAGTSNVADGATSAIPALSARSLTWDPSTSRWYRDA